jgi:predicted TIM-barrel fold metal-dependent hydrolase
MGAIDYWCNGFTSSFRPLWDAAIGEQDLSIKIRRDDDDSFTDADEMVRRLDSLGIDSLLLPAADIPGGAGPFAYERYATRIEAVAELASKAPGRFAGLYSLDPTQGEVGVARAAEALGRDDFVGLQIHTHSWDRRFDHRDYYPYYQLAADLDVPVVMQAGASGGPMPSECGQPIGIDRPAIYFGRVRFVLSHTGWPWTEEAIAMCQKHPNVFLGTAAWPAHRWPATLHDFLRGAGRGKVLFGTSFPTVGHRHGISRIDELDLDAASRFELLEGAARRVFSRLAAVPERDKEKNAWR